MNAPGDATAAATEDRAERVRTRVLLGLLSAVFFAYSWFSVPRLTNYVLSDKEFTGWSGPLAERLARGERLYTDVVLPIPPGSFALLAAVQRVTGQFILLQELWVAQVAYWVFAGIGYAIARQFASRRVALLVALCTLVLVTLTPKECVYDHTSLVVAWLSVLVGARALSSPPSARRSRLFLFTGFLATATLAFKQSTATGIVLGWGVALSYRVLVELRAGRRERALLEAQGAGRVAVGAVLGLVFVACVLVLLRASLPGFVQAVLLDGPGLKGGAGTLIANLVAFTFRDAAFSGALVPLGIVAWIAFALHRRQGTLHLGDSPGGKTVGTGTTLLFVAAAVAAFVPALLLLVSEVRGQKLHFVMWMDGLQSAPAYGFVFAGLFFGAHLRERGAVSEAARDRGHAFNATCLAAVVCSLVYCASFVRFVPFYYDVPFIPLVLVALFLATERSGLRWATPLFLGLSLLPTYGTKLNRALSADVPVRGGYWSGLRVNYRGVQLAQAAHRAQALAGQGGTVLVLPEDLMLASLIHRPRPRLRGAVLFVDQYARRLLEDDLRELDAHPPDVLVIHPRKQSDWEKLFRTWSGTSATEDLVHHVLTRMLPDYQLDSSYPTIYVWDQGVLDVYVRKDRVPPG